MNRLRLNWLIDLVAGAAFAALVMTGFLLEWVLPLGTNKSLGLAGLSRHEWGGVHLWIALTFLAVLVVHVVMHWSWICATTCGRLGLGVPSRAIMRTAAIIAGGPRSASAPAHCSPHAQRSCGPMWRRVSRCVPQSSVSNRHPSLLRHHR